MGHHIMFVQHEKGKPVPVMEISSSGEARFSLLPLLYLRLEFFSVARSKQAFTVTKAKITATCRAFTATQFFITISLLLHAFFLELGAFPLPLILHKQHKHICTSLGHLKSLPWALTQLLGSFSSESSKMRARNNYYEDLFVIVNSG
jgi:hypothetical protein